MQRTGEHTFGCLLYGDLGTANSRSSVSHTSRGWFYKREENTRALQARDEPDNSLDSPPSMALLDSPSLPPCSLNQKTNPTEHTGAQGC